MKQLHTGMAQASARHPFGEAETGRRAGEIHKKPWHASTPPARSTARRAALPGAGGRQRPHPGRASSDEPDAEKAHIEADELLCEYLRIVGAKDIVEAFQVITKYYA